MSTSIQIVAKPLSYPPDQNTIKNGNYVTVTGEITLKAANGTYNHYDYCDIWRLENGKIAELKAFVIEKNPDKNN